ALQAENSLYMAYEMLQTFKTLNVKWKNLYNINDIYLRIGIHCGIATVGSFGPEDRLSFTAIGKTVNIASRLEQACTEDSILISNDVKQLIPGVVVTQVQSLQIRGIEQHIDVYTINEPYSLNKPT
ncbi:MAG: adenylate/guanylate cyclase domain-containing protein, partial [Spirochaetota bacterium]